MSQDFEDQHPRTSGGKFALKPNSRQPAATPPHDVDLTTQPAQVTPTPSPISAEDTESPVGVEVGSSGLAGNSDDFERLLDITVAAVGLDPVSVVQDYWLTTCLHNLSQAGSPHDMLVYRQAGKEQKASAVCVFTGGTSLVSAWGITERYSEDIDLLAVDLNDEAALGTMNKARSQISNWLKTPLGQADATIKQSDNRTLGYRKMQLPVGRTGEHIKVDITSEKVDATLLGKRPVISLMGRFASTQEQEKYPELGGFDLLCTTPPYTAAAKLDALHRRSVKHHYRGLARRVRDLYDLASIARSSHAAEASEAIPDLADVMSKSFGRAEDAIPRPEGGYANSVLFKKGSDAQEALKAAYPDLDEYVWGEWLPFDDALDLAASLDLA